MADKRISYALSLSAASVVLNIVTLFVVLLWWNSAGDPPSVNTISYSITVLQTFIAIAAISGFWMIRSAALQSAREAAEKEANRIAADIAERAAFEMMTGMEQLRGKVSRKGVLTPDEAAEKYGGAYEEDE